MAGIADPNTIDLIAQEADGTFLMVMVEDRPWGAVAEQEAQLREKINTYAGYVLDGSLAQKYPETSGHAIKIRLDCVEVPTAQVAHITNYASEQLARLGIGFQVNPRS